MAWPGRHGEQVQSDTRRRRGIAQAGWVLLVFTWRDVVHRPAGVAEELRRAYEAAARRPGRAAG